MVPFTNPVLTKSYTTGPYHYTLPPTNYKRRGGVRRQLVDVYIYIYIYITEERFAKGHY